MQPIPSAEQLAWQQLETYAFIHFGLNTFNDMEWGYGDTPASTFDPAGVDCDQWAATLRNAGMKGIILTAKHHDGFCLWPSAYTDYSVKSSPWRGGKGDLVRELADACRKYGLQFGVYLSPWDRHHANYGRAEYVDYYHNQMRELLTSYGPLFEYWFDGANGSDGWYGGADEHRSIGHRTYYRYEEVRRTIRELQPRAVIFGGTCGDIRWIGNEKGYAGQTNWSFVNGPGDEFVNDFTQGEADGDTWLPGECDVSIRPGWFYHAREDNQVKSLAQLMDIYYKSVGRNANLLLNVPVNGAGRIAPGDSMRLMEWQRTLAIEFAENLLMGGDAEADNVRGREYAPLKALDGDPESYWATSDGINSATLTLRLPETRSINRLQILEYLPLGQRVWRFAVEWLDGSQWRPVTTDDEMTTVGHKRIIRFDRITTPALRIHFTDARGPLCISQVTAYHAPFAGKYGSM